MSARNGAVRGVTKVVDSGSGAERWDLVVLGDGYVRAEMSKYDADVDRIIAGIFSIAPFDRLRSAINVHRVEVESEESGAGDLCKGIRRATFFDANFCVSGLDRLLVPDPVVAFETAVDAVPTMNATLVLVNSDVYGGSGGSGIATCSLAVDAFHIALHELGHSQFGLADEYADALAPGQHRFEGKEPGAPNVTSRLAPLKWSSRTTPGVAIPTTSNPNCAKPDLDPPALPAETVGAFEGAFYHHCGVYRPQFDCKMRNVGANFCRVCAETIERVLAPYMPRRRRRSVRT